MAFVRRRPSPASRSATCRAGSAASVALLPTAMLAPALLAPALLGCDSKPAPGIEAAATAATSAPVVVSAPATAEPPAPDPLDPAPLLQELGCTAGDARLPCAVLEKMKSCKAWTAVPPSGDARYLGRASEVAADGPRETVAFFHVLGVPLDQVGPGQLPVRLGIVSLEPDDPVVEAAEKAIVALSRHDVPRSNNPALKQLESQEDWPLAYAMKTKGNQVYGITHGGLFVCQGEQNQLLLARRAASRRGDGAGLYAELWPVTW